MNRTLVVVCLCLAVCVSVTQASGAATQKENGRKLTKNAGTLIKALKQLTSLSKTGADVDDVKGRATTLKEGTAEMAIAIEDIRQKLGGESSFQNEEEELRAATSKMKLAVTKLNLTEDDYLQLIVGNGNVNVDHRRWQLSLRLLDIILLDWLEKELAAIATVTAASEIQIKLDEIKTSMDSITTILDGIIDVVDDTVLTLEKLLPNGGKSEEEDTEDKERREVGDDPDGFDEDDEIDDAVLDSPEIDAANPPDVEPLPWPKSNKQGARQLRSYERQARGWGGSIGRSFKKIRKVVRGGVKLKVGAKIRFGGKTVNFNPTVSYGLDGWRVGVRSELE